MYLFYVDESGVPTGWQQQDSFVLAGIAVHEGQVWRLSRQVDDIQSHHFPEISVPIELHASEQRHIPDAYSTTHRQTFL
jgi:hypothetical protein